MTELSFLIFWSIWWFSWGIIIAWTSSRKKIKLQQLMIAVYEPYFQTYEQVHAQVMENDITLIEAFNNVETINFNIQSMEWDDSFK